MSIFKRINTYKKQNREPLYRMKCVIKDIGAYKLLTDGIILLKEKNTAPVESIALKPQGTDSCMKQ